jgi:hypothetical protein
MQQKFLVRQAIEFRQSSLAKTPKSLNAIDVTLASCKFIFTVKNTIMIVAIQN